MKFEEVLTALRKGKKIRESFWKEGLYLVLNDLGRFAGTYIDFTRPKNICAPSKIELDLLLENDWEIIKETKKVKLRDLTAEQYEKWIEDNCYTVECEDCIFCNVYCRCANDCWVKNKDLYSDKFLDQEVEIEED